MKNPLIVFAIVLIVLAGGYFVWQSQPKLNPPGDVSVTVQTSGGFCVDGCQPHTYGISKDGISTDGEENRPIAAAQYDRLVALVRELDEDDFPKKPEGRLCPSAFDAVDMRYTFVQGAQTLTADNCEDVVPEDHPLVALINELIYPPSE